MEDLNSDHRVLLTEDAKLVLTTGKYFFEFEIPLDLSALWRYMGQMYNLDAFTQSCPADQDIINHYKQQMHVKLSRHEELETPTYTNSTPSEGKPARSLVSSNVLSLPIRCL